MAATSDSGGSCDFNIFCCANADCSAAECCRKHRHVPAPKYPIGGDQPETSSGSPTYPLDVFAAVTPDRKSLTLSVVNATEEPQKFDLNFTGKRLAGRSTVWQLTGKSLDAVNKVGEQPQVEVKEMPIDKVQGLSVAAISVNIYRFPVAVARLAGLGGCVGKTDTV